MVSLVTFTTSFMIPEDKKTAVSRALQQTFGVTEFEEISQLTAGLSTALIFRIVVKGNAYLLRIITSNEAVADPTWWFGCMQAGADAGIAPQVWYTSTEDKIAITDFINAKPFPPAEARLKMPVLLKRLHTLPNFPNRLNYLDVADLFIKKYRAANIIPAEMTDELFTQYEKVRKVYPRNESDLVGCHNDLKPENILFDGDQAWLIDWEAAFINDRYFDLAIVANFVVTNDQEEREYLKNYFGEEPTEYQLARFFLMRQVLHMAYFTFFMNLLPAAGKTFDWDLPKPKFREYNDRMWVGEIDLKDIEERQQYAWVHMEQLRHNFGLKRFEEALEIVGSFAVL